MLCPGLHEYTGAGVQGGRRVGPSLSLSVLHSQQVRGGWDAGLPGLAMSEKGPLQQPWPDKAKPTEAQSVQGCGSESPRQATTSTS